MFSDPIVRPGGTTTCRTARAGCLTAALAGSSLSTTRTTSTAAGRAAVAAMLARKAVNWGTRPRVGTIREKVGRGSIGPLYPAFAGPVKPGQPPAPAPEQTLTQSAGAH